MRSAATSGMLVVRLIRWRRVSVIWSRLVAIVVVLVGAVAFASFGRDEAPRWTAAGSGWHALRADGTTLEVTSATPGLTLTDGIRLELNWQPDESDIEISTLLEGASTQLFVHFDGDDHSVLVDAAGASALVVANVAGEREIRDRRAVPLGPDGRVAVRLQVREGAARAHVNGVPLFDWTPTAGTPIDTVVVTSARGTLRVDGVSFTRSADSPATVNTLTPQAPLVHMTARLRRALGVGVVIAGLFALARLVAKPLPDAWTLAFIAPAPLALAWILAAVSRRQPSALATAGLVGFGLVSAAWLGRRVQATPHAAPRASRWLAVGALVAALFVIADKRAERLEADFARKHAADQLSRPRSTETPTAQRLDAGNALVFEEPYRDVDLAFTLNLNEHSALLVRTRAPDVDIPVGTSLVLSTDARRQRGWVVETPADYLPLGTPAPTLTPTREHTVDVRIRGQRFEARLDGQLVSSVESTTHVSGGIVLLATPGEATVRDLVITPVVPAETPRTSYASSLALAATLAALVASLLALALRTAPRATPVLDLLGVTGLALAPLTTLAAFTARHPSTSEVTLCSALTIAVIALALCWSRLRALVAVLALVGAGLAIPPMMRMALEPRPDTEGMSLNELRFTAWHGPRLHDDLLALEHPLHRRFDFYLARHTFRERSYAVPKPANVQRVAVIGGSSTWGYRLGADAAWPAQLETRLQQTDADTEVLNAGIQAGIGPRLVRLLRDVVLPFEPDVVVVSLTFNDSFAHSRADEDAYLADITAPEYERNWWRDALDRHAEELGRTELRELASDFAQADPGTSTLDVWQERSPEGLPPPTRFTRVLEDFADVCEAHDVALVFVQEPVRGDAERLWKDEFHGAMAAVGDARGVPVVNPWPALATAGATGEAMFLDGIHPTAAGCVVIAGAVEPAVRAALSSR